MDYINYIKQSPMSMGGMGGVVASYNFSAAGGAAPGPGYWDGGRILAAGGDNGGPGGVGIDVTPTFGSLTAGDSGFFAGGGGGLNQDGSSQTPGGNGGGGNGGTGPGAGGANEAGTANTGGGAGGGPAAVAGGSGVVIVKESIRQISGIWTMNDQYEYKKNDEWCENGH